MDLSPVLFVIEVTQAQRVFLHVVNCSEKNSITIHASNLTAEPIPHQYFDTRRNIAVHDVQLNLSGPPVALEKFRNLEQFGHLKIDATECLDATKLREGAMVVRIQFNMDGKSEEEVAWISCPNMESAPH